MRKLVYIIAGILGTLTILMFAPYLMYLRAENVKAEWDRQIREWCETEGGITVFEQIDVSKQQYPDLVITPRGVSIPSRMSANTDDPFFYSNRTEILSNDQALIRRHTNEIVRSIDSKVLGRRVSFSRVGGDFYPFGFGTESSFSCSRVDGFNSDLNRAVFNLTAN